MEIKNAQLPHNEWIPTYLIGTLGAATSYTSNLTNKMKSFCNECEITIFRNKMNCETVLFLCYDEYWISEEVGEKMNIGT